jgi:hypothetical protein
MLINRLLWIFATSTMLLVLSACASSLYWEPDVRINRLFYQAGEQTLKVELRIRNPSDNSQTVGQLNTQLWLSGETVLELEQDMQLEIPAGGVELVSLNTPPISNAIAWLIEHRQALPYRLVTDIRAASDERRLTSETEAKLEATPGLDNQYR